jgi:hypothetical protein
MTLIRSPENLKSKTLIRLPLKGQCHENFLASGFFHESISYQPQSIPLVSFRIFEEIKKIFAPGVNDNGGAP